MVAGPELIHDIPSAGAARWPDRLALVSPEAFWSYRELAQRVGDVAAALRRLVTPGARVAVVGDNSADYVSALYAAPLAGTVLTLVNQRLHSREQAQLCDRVGATVVLGDPEHLDGLQSARPNAQWRRMPFPLDTTASPDEPDRSEPGTTSPSDPAWLIHTSGTTGPPKAVPLTHRNLTAGIAAGARGRPVHNGDVYLFPFPLCHVAAYNVLLQHHHGTTVILTAGFEAAATLAAVERHRVTTMSLAPTMIVRLLEHPALTRTDLSSLRSIGYGAAALPADVRARAADRLGCELIEGYGMTELAGNAVFDGRPDEAIDLRVVDVAGSEQPPGTDGEIEARGPQVIDGYWRDAAATEAAFIDDWFRTGDIGRFDRAGRLTIVDRRKDIIITGGENVASREVEEVLATHPGVAEVAVVGLPDPEWGERIVAVIVTAGDDTERDLTEQVTAHCRRHLAGFKTPRQVEIVEALPVTATGKIDKRALKASVGG